MAAMLQQRNMPAEDDHAWHQSSLPHSARRREALPAELSDEDVESSQMARTNYWVDWVALFALASGEMFR